MKNLVQERLLLQISVSTLFLAPNKIEESYKIKQIYDSKEVPESPLRPPSGGGTRRLFDGGNRRDWFPRGPGAIPAPIENHTNGEA
jgi:hypothetical protein